MFTQWGYRFILSSAADVVRRIVMDHEKPPAELEQLVLRNVSPLPSVPLQLVRLKDDTAILVVVTLVVADGISHYYGAVMPNPSLEPDEVIRTLCSAATVLRERGRTVTPQESVGSGKMKTSEERLRPKRAKG
jgi:hypothetical protein